MALIDRIVEHPGRIKLTDVLTGEELGTFDVERMEGEITEEGSPLNAETLNSEIQQAADSACAELKTAITVDANNNVSYKNRQMGSAVVKPAAVKATTKVSVKFPKAFSKVPFVVVTPVTTAPNVVSCSVQNIKTTGFDLYMYRTTKVNTTVHWMAGV